MAFYALPPSGNAMPPAFLLGAGDASFASAFAEHAGVREDAILFTDSGTAALHVAFRAVAAARGGGRVAVPAWCCPSVPQAAIQAGLVPVLVDLDPATLGYAPASLEAARAQLGGLAAVVLVHFFGTPAQRPAGDWGDTIFIRDCAQDFDYAPDPQDGCPRIYSFGRGKALNSGHGGALCLPAASGAYADACRAAHAELPVSGARPWAKALAINVLSHPRVYWAVTALPGLGIGATVWDAPLEFARLSPYFPRLGSACLEAYLQRRNGYRALLGRYRALAQACDPARAFHPAPAGAWTPISVTMRFPMLFPDADLRAEFFARVKARFGGVTRMYPAVLTELPGSPAGLLAAEGDAYAPETFPGARKVAREIVTLPVAAALMGREEVFTGFLEDVLRERGALRTEAVAARDWSPVPERMPRPALFPTS